MICGDELNLECAKRHPDRKEIQNSEVEIVDKDKKSILLESLLRHTDKLSCNVKARIIFAGDIRAVEAKYHRRCIQSFMTGDYEKKEAINPRNINYLNSTDQFCEKLYNKLTLQSI